jgi:hypothetical protein
VKDVEAWLHAFQVSPLRLPGRAPDGLSGLADAIADVLPEDMMGTPGAPELREAEKRWTFAGGALAASGASAFDVMAFVTSLRDVAGGKPELFDWFAALALEGWGASRLDALRGRAREALEKGTPVLQLGRGVPAALLVGEPDRLAVETTLSRLLLLVARTGAPAVVIDATGLTRPDDPAVRAGVAAFASHPRLPKLSVVVTGLGRAAPAWREAFPRAVRLFIEDELAEGVARAETLA